MLDGLSLSIAGAMLPEADYKAVSESVFEISLLELSGIEENLVL